MLGIIMTMSACTSSITQSLTMNSLRLANLAMAIPACTGCHPLIPANLTPLDNQAQEMNSTVEDLYTNHIAHEDDIGFCATCHDSQLTIYSNITDDDYEQSILMPSHTGQIVDCEVCHRQQPVHTLLLLRGEN